MPTYNEAINPKQEVPYSLTLTPCRAEEIKEAKKAPKSTIVGGVSNLRTGTVTVPTEDTAEARTIRLHEAMHCAHTSKQSKPADMLDQALEDARLHRYCSKTSVSEYQQARRDELSVALRDLRNVSRTEKLAPIASLSTLRAMAILKAGSSIAPSHANLLDRVISRFGKTASRDFSNALIQLSNCDGNTKTDAWQDARKPLLSYFDADFGTDLPPTFSPETSEPEAPSESGDSSDSKSSKPSDSESAEASEDATDTSASHADSKDLEESEDESSDDTEDTTEDKAEDERADSPIDPTDDTPTEDETKAKTSPESESESKEEIEDLKPRTMAPIVEAPKTPKAPRKKSSAHPDEYTADLTPECDAATFKSMDEECHLKLMIRRLDMGINRVKLSLGRRQPMPVISGRSIVARKLASAMTTPGTRAMSRPTAKGGFGTILIDASGSMDIPEDALIRFCAAAPALTIAFYNAPGDWVGDAGHQGNIFIYAANGYRASCKTIGSSIPHYGGGNLIDYQVLAWLIKQPAPRYIVTDCGFTGPWTIAAHRLIEKLIASKQVIHVPTLYDVTQIMKEERKKR